MQTKRNSSCTKEQQPKWQKNKSSQLGRMDMKKINRKSPEKLSKFFFCSEHIFSLIFYSVVSMMLNHVNEFPMSSTNEQCFDFIITFSLHGCHVKPSSRSEFTFFLLEMWLTCNFCCFGFCYEYYVMDHSGKGIWEYRCVSSANFSLSLFLFIFSSIHILCQWILPSIFYLVTKIF